MQIPAIQVRNLRKSFRKRNGFRKKSELWAIDDVSFSVAQGETYGLLGPNGSGKSSLIRILSTLLIADSGYVPFAGFHFARARGRGAPHHRPRQRGRRFLQEALGA